MLLSTQSKPCVSGPNGAAAVYVHVWGVWPGAGLSRILLLLIGRAPTPHHTLLTVREDKHCTVFFAKLRWLPPLSCSFPLTFVGWSALFYWETGPSWKLLALLRPVAGCHWRHCHRWSSLILFSPVSLHPPCSLPTRPNTIFNLQMKPGVKRW